jgi:hypothetical protein
MTDFNYDMPGEFYSRKSQGLGPSGLAYRRFDTVAEAIRFAIEDLSPAALGGCMLEVGGQRFGGKEVKALYASPRFPLQRAKGLQARSTEKNKEQRRPAIIPRPR